MDTLARYFSESIEELRHVRWPTRQQAVRLSVIVILFTLASSAIFGFVDFLLSQGVTLLLNFTY